MVGAHRRVNIFLLMGYPFAEPNMNLMDLDYGKCAPFLRKINVV